MGILDLFRGSESTRIAKRFMAELRAAGEARTMRFDEAANVIRILGPDGIEVVQASIVNLRHDLRRADTTEVDQTYRKYATSVRELGVRDALSYGEVKSRLGILLKDASYPDFINVMNRAEYPNGGASPLAYQAVAADIVACLVEESEVSLRFVKQEDLEQWGVSVEQVLADAVSRLAVMPFEWRYYGSNVAVFADDSFQSARLLCVERFRELALRGRPVVVVPDRDTLLLAGSDDDEGLAKLARLVEQQLSEANRHISSRPLVLGARGWESFEPPESVRHAFERLHRLFDANAWASYAEFAQKVFTNQGEDIFVASFTVYENADSGICRSYAVWSADVDTILPKVDEVMFFEAEERPTRRAAWDAVQRAMGPEMERQEGLPERYRVRTFPTAEQFLGMGAELQVP